MDDPIRGVGPGAVLLAALVSLAVAACGSSSGGSDASSLLKQTFSGSHPVNSGNLSFSLVVNPSGSSTLRSPITLSFGGPFQSMGKGKLPKSDFNVSLTARGSGGTLGIVSTGTAGYVTLQGVSYQLPAGTFQKLESSFSGIATSPGSGSGSGTLSKLGIHPLDWLSNPAIVGNETLDGTSTTHIRAAINVAALLADLGTFLQKASSVGVSSGNKLSALSPATRSKIAGEIRNPTFDVWTGDSDKTIRKLMIRLTLPVTGQISTLLGGMSSAGVALTMRYADLNQPQTISAPTNVRPFSEFQSKLRPFLSAIEGGVGATASSETSTSASSSPSASGASSPTVRRYSQCITAAHNDVAKMQQCAALINGQ
jgi:hypothetical protein